MSSHAKKMIGCSDIQSEWLLARGSLTEKLKYQFNCPLSVQRTREQKNQQWFSREVILNIQDRPMIAALSKQYLSKQSAPLLADIGQTPLGEHLFQEPTLRRSQIYAKHGPLPKQFHSETIRHLCRTDLWYRFSKFYFRTSIVLVIECFLPPLWDALTQVEINNKSCP